MKKTCLLFRHFENNLKRYQDLVLRVWFEMFFSPKRRKVLLS